MNAPCGVYVALSLDTDKRFGSLFRPQSTKDDRIRGL
jgi:hypothetical protein